MIAGPVARIIIRYVLGTILGAAVANAVLNDPDLMTLIGIGVAAVGSWAVERIYIAAKKRGWAL